MSTPSHHTSARQTARAPRFVVIGAGMSGILSAIKLREAGFDDVAIYEKADRLGGTWRENTYPGIACDVPSHFYSYSFAPNPEWSHRFAPGAEIQAYFEDVARRYGVDALIRYGKEITRCAFEDGRWRIATRRRLDRRGGRRHRRDRRAPPPERIPTSTASTPSPARASTARAGITTCRSPAGASASSARARARSRSSARWSTRWRSCALFQRTAAVDHADAEPGLQRRGEGRVPQRPGGHRAAPRRGLAPVHRRLRQRPRRR